MNGSAPDEETRESARSWAIVAGIAMTFLAWGLFIFFLIGEKGPPDWQYSVIPDVPGESVYSTHDPGAPTGLVPRPKPGYVDEQHVAGPPAEVPGVEAPGQ
jgi:hypothetical protein